MMSICKTSSTIEIFFIDQLPCRLQCDSIQESCSEEGLFGLYRMWRQLRQINDWVHELLFSLKTDSV